MESSSSQMMKMMEQMMAQNAILAAKVSAIEGARGGDGSDSGSTDSKGWNIAAPSFEPRGYHTSVPVFETPKPLDVTRLLDTVLGSLRPCGGNLEAFHIIQELYRADKSRLMNISNIHSNSSNPENEYVSARFMFGAEKYATLHCYLSPKESKRSNYRRITSIDMKMYGKVSMIATFASKY